MRRRREREERRGLGPIKMAAVKMAAVQDGRELCIPHSSSSALTETPSIVCAPQRIDYERGFTRREGGLGRGEERKRERHIHSLSISTERIEVDWGLAGREKDGDAAGVAARLDGRGVCGRDGGDRRDQGRPQRRHRNRLVRSAPHGAEPDRSARASRAERKRSTGD